MLFECDLQSSQGEEGQEFCLRRCPVRDSHLFEYVRVDRAADRPAADPRAVDVGILDMNHGWPNVGHDAIVMGIRMLACDVRDELEAAGLRVRVVSCDVRRDGGLPAPPDDDGGVYVGTGGPGHLDPRRNDGVSDGSQTIIEDPAWEAPLFDWLDAVRAHPRAALLGVCHTFGVMCRWLRIADPVLRGPEKGGKSAGVLENLLTPAAHAHPWFERMARESADGARIRVLDNRLYDLLPPAPHTGLVPAAPAPGTASPGAAPPDPAAVFDAAGVTVLSTETLGVGGPAGPGLTMIEAARDADGVMPRILAVNHHPEIVNRTRILMVLWQKRARGEVTHEWYEERARALTATLEDADGDRRLDLTSRYTFFEPLRFHLYRRIRHRAARLAARGGPDPMARRR